MIEFKIDSLTGQGSSSFLKDKYGIGYNLTVSRGANCDVAGITRAVRTLVPDMKVQPQVGPEVKYFLPRKYCSVFQQLFSHLETHTEAYGISGFKASCTTFDEVLPFTLNLMNDLRWSN